MDGMFYNSDDEGSVSLSDLNRNEISKHRYQLQIIEDKLYAEEFIVQENEVIDESDNRFYYQQLDNTVDDIEILSWKNNFPYIRVVTSKIEIKQLKEAYRRQEQYSIPNHIVELNESGDYIIVASDNVIPDDEESDEVYAQDGDEAYCSSDGRHDQAMQILSEIWPRVVDELRPLIREVILSAKGEEQQVRNCL
jgi:uncharacterized protein YktA (UPF0223 family)